VDIPKKKREKTTMPIDPRIPQCNHIKVNGLRCGSPSLKGRPYCYFHYSVTRPLIRTDLPVLEDAGAVQYSLNRLAEYILEKRIDYKQASLLLWLMQIASSNARNARLEPFLKEDMVREHPDDSYFPNALSKDSVAEGSEPLAQADASFANAAQPAADDDDHPHAEQALTNPRRPSVSSVSSVVKNASSPKSSAFSAGSALNPALRKPPTRQELEEAAARAIEKFRNTPPIEEVAPNRKNRRKA
jgi:hypothetical protein